MNDKNKRKAVLGTIVATGLAAGMACNATAGATTDNRVSAADRIVINGKALNVGKALSSTEQFRREKAMYAKAEDKRIDRRVRPMYGPPRPLPKPVVRDTVVEEDVRVVEDVYGPPPVFDMMISFDDVKDFIFFKVADAFSIELDKVDEKMVISYDTDNLTWDEINANILEYLDLEPHQFQDGGFDFRTNEQGEAPTLGEYVEAIYHIYLIYK